MSDWLPIESAPRYSGPRFCVIGYDAKRGKWWSDGDAHYTHMPLKFNDGEVTHIVYDGWTTRRALYWQPLPPPPSV